MPRSYQINEIQLSYKRPQLFNEMVSVQNSESAYSVLHGLWDQNRIELAEDFKVLVLNSALKILGVFNVSSGGSNGVAVDSKMIFVAALKANVTSIILAHNHPTGNLTPSKQDIQFTTRLKSAGELLDIKVQDHIIVTNDGYYSFGDGLAYEKVTAYNNVTFEALPPF